MRKKSQKNYLRFIAGAISIGVIVGFVGISTSITGQLLSSGGNHGTAITSNSQKPDLSVIKSATDSVAWDGTFAVNYSVTNRGAKVAQAFTIEPYFTGSFDNVKRVFVPSPISYLNMKTADGIAPNRVGCGTGGGNLRCAFIRGINAGETLEFTVFYAVNKAPVQCDRVLSMAAATIVSGLNLNPSAVQSSLRNDANPADNMSASHSVRIDCASITGDLQAEVTGPDVLAKNGIGEFTVTLRNIGSVVSSTVPVQVTVPANGFDIVKAEGKERGGMCVKTIKDSTKQLTCINPSIQLASGQVATYRIKLRARTQECTSGTIKAEISKQLKTPTPKFSEIYDTNDDNNMTSMQVSCDQNSSVAEDEPQPQKPNPWGYITPKTNPYSPVPSSTPTQPKNNWGGFFIQ